MGERLRRINWSAAFEVNGPFKDRGPGDGARYEVKVDGLVSHGKREGEFRISVYDTSKSKVGVKAMDQSFFKVMSFVQSGLRKPLNPLEREKFANEFLDRFITDANINQSRQ